MKNKILNFALAVASVTAVLSASTARAADENLPKECQQAVADFLKTDPTLQTFVDKSAGYAIFPSVGKGGLVVGGAHGTGLVYEKSKPTGQAKLSQASIGAQIGGQSFSEIIFFENPLALEDFKSGKFEMSADVSAVAASEGASKAADYKRGVAVFTLARKGLMVQAAIGGQKFSFEPMK